MWFDGINGSGGTVKEDNLVKGWLECVGVPFTEKGSVSTHYVEFKNKLGSERHEHICQQRV